MNCVDQFRVSLIVLFFGQVLASGQQIVQVPVSERARRIHNSTFVFDGHNDLPYTLR